ncbi:Zinc finger domain containing protein [Rhypophila sp. PSN 637]
MSLLDLSDISSLPRAPDQSTATSPDTDDLKKTLRRLLSLNSALSKFSSTTDQSSSESTQHTKFRKIGAGQCGVVFAPTSLNGPQKAYKFARVPNPTNTPQNEPQATDLLNDSASHTDVWHAFNTHYVAADTDSWNWLSGLGYPEEELTAAAREHITELPTDVLVTQRIVPLPKETRDALVDVFCANSDKMRESIKNCPSNEDCLVRVYLGGKKPRPKAYAGGGKFFSLRNFQLNVDQMVWILDLEDVLEVGKQIGIALAVMHCGAKTDARDVEFVLGSSRERVEPTDGDVKGDDSAVEDLQGQVHVSSMDIGRKVRSTQMWVLDFNQCRKIEFDEEGVKMMVEAVKLNDPYFPKPLRETDFERAVWTVFVRAYLAASERILREIDDKMKGEACEYGAGLERKVFDLPERFVLGVMELERERRTKKEDTVQK